MRSWQAFAGCIVATLSPSSSGGGFDCEEVMRCCSCCIIWFLPGHYVTSSLWLGSRTFLRPQSQLCKGFFSNFGRHGRAFRYSSLFRVWWAVPLWACRLQSDSGWNWTIFCREVQSPSILKRLPRCVGKAWQYGLHRFCSCGRTLSLYGLDTLDLLDGRSLYGQEFKMM